MASNWTQGGLVRLMGAGNAGSDTFKMGLLKNTYTPNKDHDLVSEINANECDATGYAGGFGGAGRKTLTSPTITADDANDRAVFDSADPAPWSPLGGATNNTLRYAFVCWESGSDAASIVITINDMGADKATNGGDFTVQNSANGIGYVST